MRETTSPATKTIGATESADDVLGQFYFSFGQGAGTMRVERAAVAALRRRYFDNIKAAPAPWSAMSGSVLPLIAQVGRLAALLATQAGRTAITEADFMQARKTVESAVHPRANDTRRLVVGAVCAIIPEEDEQDDAGTEGGDAHDLFDMPVTSIRTN